MTDERRGRFATTEWRLVLAAAHPSHPDAGEALASLCEAYWDPVYAFIRRQGHGAEEARDLTQAFFARLLEKNYLRTADPHRGRFRNFLCAAVKHFLSDERDRARALKRGGDRRIASLDVTTAENRLALEPRDDLTPEKLFDRRWALTLLDCALRRVQTRQAAAGKAELFDRLKGHLTGDDDGQPYVELASRLQMSEGAVRVAIHRLRRQFRGSRSPHEAGRHGLRPPHALTRLAPAPAQPPGDHTRADIDTTSPTGAISCEHLVPRPRSHAVVGEHALTPGEPS